MGKKSAGILIYRKRNGKIEVFLGHPGGPYWKGKEERAWSIPKGELDEGESEFECALRELKEETGISLAQDRDFIDLGEVVRRDGRPIRIWAVEEQKGDWSGPLICKSWVTMEYPPRTGRKIQFTEVDKAGFYSADKAKTMLHASQEEFVKRLIEKIGS